MPGFIQDANGIWRFEGSLVGDAAVALEANAGFLSTITQNANRRTPIFKSILDQMGDPFTSNNLAFLPDLDSSTIASIPLTDGKGALPIERMGAFSPGCFGTPIWGQGYGGSIGFNKLQKLNSGSYLILNGASQGLEIDTLLDNFPVTGAIQFWFKPNSLLPLTAPLFSKVTCQSVSNFNELEIFIGDNGTIRSRIYSSNVQTTLFDSRSQGLNIPDFWNLVTFNFGVGGTQLFVNDQFEGSGNSTIVPNNNDGSGETGCFFGCHFDNSSSRFADISLFGIRILNRQIGQLEHLSNWYRRSSIPTASALTRVTRSTPYPLLTSSDNSTGETILRRQNNLFLVHRNKGVTPHLNLDTSPDFINWTDLGNVYGQGVGGEIGSIYQPSCFDEAGSTYFYYVRSGADDLQMALSLDTGYTVNKISNIALTRAEVSSLGIPVSALAASGVIKRNNQYMMWFEAKVTSSGSYKIGLATSDSPTGPFLAQVFPLMTLERGAGGTYGGPSVIEIDDDLLLMIYHASSGPNELPTSAYMAISYGGVYWQQIKGPVLRPINATTEGSQIANLVAIIFEGKIYFLATAADNTQTIFTIIGAIANVPDFKGLLLETPQSGQVSLDQAFLLFV